MATRPVTGGRFVRDPETGEIVHVRTPFEMAAVLLAGPIPEPEIIDLNDADTATSAPAEIVPEPAPAPARPKKRT